MGITDKVIRYTRIIPIIAQNIPVNRQFEIDSKCYPITIIPVDDEVQASAALILG